jgi:hypothetical protein
MDSYRKSGQKQALIYLPCCITCTFVSRGDFIRYLNRSVSYWSSCVSLHASTLNFPIDFNWSEPSFFNWFGLPFFAEVFVFRPQSLFGEPWFWRQLEYTISTFYYGQKCRMVLEEWEINDWVQCRKVISILSIHHVHTVFIANASRSVVFNVFFAS